MTEAEARDFWDTHTVTDEYLASMPPVSDADFPPIGPSRKYQAVHLKRDVFQKARQLARERGVRVDDLIDDLVTKALDASESNIRASMQSVKLRLAETEGIDPVNATKLRGIGISTIEDLLDRGSTRSGLQEIAQATGARDDQVLRWVNHADLYRIKGVGAEFAELLEAAGVNSVPELAQRSPTSLLKRMEAVNEQKKLTRRVPSEPQVTAWVAEAKTLGRAIRH
jgi:predicted flap endonuclease-1-like 5' DNA nuclease